MLLFVVSLIATLALIVVTLHDSYELRRRLRHASTILQRAIIIGRLCFLWIITLATALTAYLSKVDSDAKDKRIADLQEELAAPVITKKAHDYFVAALKKAPKGEIPVLIAGTSSVGIATYAKQIRSMLDDAGYAVKNGEGFQPELELSVTSNEGNEDSDIAVWIDEVPNNLPPYEGLVAVAFYNAGIKVGIIDDNGYIKKGQIGVIVVEPR